MSNWGFQWGDFGFAQTDVPADFDAISIANAASQITEAISLNGKTSAEVAATVVVPDAAVDGNVIVYLLKEGATGWQTSEDALYPLITITAVRDETLHGNAAVPADWLKQFKVLAVNSCGQTVDVSIKVRTSEMGGN